MGKSKFDSVREKNQDYAMRAKPLTMTSDAGVFRNVVYVTLYSEGESVEMCLNAGGLVEAIKRGVLLSVCVVEGNKAKTLLEQLKYVDCRGMDAHEVFFLTHSITAVLPNEFGEASFDAMGTAMANSGIAKLKASGLSEFEANVMCGSLFAIAKDGNKFVLVKQGVDDPGLLDVDEQQLKKLSAAAEQDPEMAVALEILTADCSEEQEVLWKGETFDEKFCTVIAKYYPAFAKFVDLGIDWNKPE